MNTRLTLEQYMKYSTPCSACANCEHTIHRRGSNTAPGLWCRSHDQRFSLLPALEDTDPDLGGYVDVFRNKWCDFYEPCLDTATWWQKEGRDQILADYAEHLLISRISN